MPVTPYHFGPGAALKACAPKYFSFTTFVLAQIVIDLEPLYFLLKREYPWHRFMHTFAGATLVVCLTILLSKPFRLVLERILRWVDEPKAQMPSVSWCAIVVGAVIGAYSHIWLDSVMHDDVFPLAPFSFASPVHQAISIDDLEAYCLSVGVIGGLLLTFRYRKSLK